MQRVRKEESQRVPAEQQMHQVGQIRRVPQVRNSSDLSDPWNAAEPKSTVLAGCCACRSQHWSERAAWCEELTPCCTHGRLWTAQWDGWFGSFLPMLFLGSPADSSWDSHSLWPWAREGCCSTPIHVSASLKTSPVHRASERHGVAYTAEPQNFSFL